MSNVISLYDKYLKVDIYAETTTRDMKLVFIGHSWEWNTEQNEYRGKQAASLKSSGKAVPSLFCVKVVDAMQMSKVG